MSHQHASKNQGVFLFRDHGSSLPLTQPFRNKWARRWSLEMLLFAKQNIRCGLTAHLPNFSCLLWIPIGSSRPQTEEKKHRTPDRRLGRRKLQLKLKFCFVFQRSFGDKFSISCTFFRHEQRVSLRLPLSVLSEIIVSWNKQFCTPKIIVPRRHINLNHWHSRFANLSTSLSRYYSLIWFRYRFMQYISKVEIVFLGLTLR